MKINDNNIFLSNDISVDTIKDNFKLDSGIQSKVLAFAFGLSAEIERNLIWIKEVLGKIQRYRNEK